MSLEEILARDPDVLAVFSVEDLQTAKQALLSLPGAESLKAVRSDDVLVIRFDYVDPPTSLSVEGLEVVTEAFAPGP